MVAVLDYLKCKKCEGKTFERMTVKVTNVSKSGKFRCVACLTVVECEYQELRGCVMIKTGESTNDRTRTTTISL